MLVAVFLTTCETVLSEMPLPQSLSARQTHRNNGPLAIPAASIQASSVSFTQVDTGTVRMCLPLPTLILPEDCRDTHAMLLVPLTGCLVKARR
jgi:hypothetical protein